MYIWGRGLTVDKNFSITGLTAISLSFSEMYCKLKYTLHEIP